MATRAHTGDRGLVWYVIADEPWVLDCLPVLAENGARVAGIYTSPESELSLVATGHESLSSLLRPRDSLAPGGRCLVAAVEGGASHPASEAGDRVEVIYPEARRAFLVDTLAAAIRDGQRHVQIGFRARERAVQRRVRVEPSDTLEVLWLKAVAELLSALGQLLRPEAAAGDARARPWGDGSRSHAASGAFAWPAGAVLDVTGSPGASLRAIAARDLGHLPHVRAPMFVRVDDSLVRVDGVEVAAATARPDDAAISARFPGTSLRLRGRRLGGVPGDDVLAQLDAAWREGQQHLSRFRAFAAPTTSANPATAEALPVPFEIAGALPAEAVVLLYLAAIGPEGSAVWYTDTAMRERARVARGVLSPIAPLALPDPAEPIARCRADVEAAIARCRNKVLVSHQEERSGIDPQRLRSAAVVVGATPPDLETRAWVTIAIEPDTRTVEIRPGEDLASEQASGLERGLLQFARELSRAGDVADTPLRAACRALAATAAPPSPFPPTLPEQIRHAAEAWSERPAVVMEQTTTTYAALWRQATAVAAALRARGLRAGERVAVHLPRGAERVSVMLGVWLAGGALVPLSSRAPASWNARVLRLARPRYVVSDGGDHATGHGTDHVSGAGDAEVLTLAWLFDQDASASAVTPGHDQTAYVIFTSGTTGDPKGVQVAHRGLACLAQTLVRELEVTADSRVLQFSSCAFDGSMWEYAMALAAGATLVMADEDTRISGRRLGALLERSRVSHISVTPTVLAMIPPDRYPALSHVVVAGEATPLSLARTWAADRRLYNSYGPTEATVGVTLHPFSPDDASLPIGRPIAGAQLLVCNEGRPAPSGWAGELYIAGVGLADGYVDDPEATARCFTAFPGGEPRAFRTGDRAVRKSDGAFELRGRLDRQVKIRGNRVELALLEETMLEHADVRAAVATVEGGPAEQRLHVYVLPRESFDGRLVDLPAALREHVARRLPGYYLPAISLIHDLPRTGAGKVDVARLGDYVHGIGSGAVAPAAEGDDASDDVRAALLDIYARALSPRSVGPDDDFYDLGGQSIVAATISAMASDRFGIEVEPGCVFEHSTVRALAAVIVEQLGSASLESKSERG